MAMVDCNLFCHNTCRDVVSCLLFLCVWLSDLLDTVSVMLVCLRNRLKTRLLSCVFRF
eukprot:XP_001706768.1 Hypothetical protein GL50803_37734 [Giardia lamblia ATCC 50803]